MRKSIIFLLAILTGIQVFAQNNNVVTAYMSLGYYQKDKDIPSLNKAREYIDMASVHENTSQKPKTWYYRGNIYLSMHESKDPSFAAQKNEFLKQAAESYEKVYNLDPKYEFAKESYEKALIAYRNLGIISFNEKNYPAALAFFEKVVEMTEKSGNVDKDAVQNSAATAMYAGNFDKAILHYNRMIATNADTTGMLYGQLYKAHIAKGDSATALSTLQAGRAKFPNNQSLLTENLNYLFKKKQNAEAESLLKLAIQNDPTNHTLYLAAGSTYESLGRMDEAVASYKKAIELKPDAWQAYFNLGAYYNNEGKKLQDIANNEKDNKKYDLGIKKADEQLQLALANLEKAKDIIPADSPDRMDLLKALKQLYVRLNMTDKFEAIKKEIEP